MVFFCLKISLSRTIDIKYSRVVECFMSEVMKIKTITLRLDDDLHQQLKIHSAKTRENMQDILIRLVKQELEGAEEEK